MPAPLRTAAIVAAAATVLSCSLAPADEAEATAAAVRKVIIDGSAKSGPKRVTVDLFGRSARAQLLRAGDDGIVVRASGMEAPIKWSKLRPVRTASIAGAYAKTGRDHLAIGRYLAASGLTDEARKACNKATAADGALAAEAKVITDAISAAATRKRQAAAEKARVRRAAAEAARKERERIARMRLNHEGRELPQLPKFDKPVLCNTPEADRILSSLQVFPKDSHWNLDISKLPVLPNSDALCNNLARGQTGRAATGFSFSIVPPNQPKVEVVFDPYPASCDKEPYPIPDDMPVQNWEDQRSGTGDRHAAVIDPWNMKIYEMYHTYRTATGWKAFGCIFDISSNKLRRVGLTSSDAAGMPIFPCLVRYDECERGMVEHAMRACVPLTRNEYIYPATHRTATGTSKDLPAMGQRFRLKAGVDISGFSKHAKAMALGLKKYGFFVTDNGDEMAICAVSDKRLRLRDIRKLKKTDYEAVDTSSLPVPKR